MAKKLQLSEAFMSDAKPKFNMVNELVTAPSFKLPCRDYSKEEALIDDIFQDDLLASQDKIKAHNDLENLKKLSSEIKATSNFCAAFIGEKVFRAREILKPYRDGTFIKWVDYTFSSRSTGYNYLYYYELYSSLPEDSLRELYKKMHLRAAYTLASRGGDLEVKAEIIKEYHSFMNKDVVPIIQKKLPLKTNDKRPRGVSISKTLRKLNLIFENLEKQKEEILANEEFLDMLYKINTRLEGLLFSGNK